MNEKDVIWDDEVTWDDNQQQPQQQPQQGQQEQTKLEQRPSAIADLTRNPISMQHPLGALLRTMGGAAELYQGVPASMALDLQAGRPQDIIPNLGKVLTGQRPAQYGDVYRGAGVPEPLAATAGLLNDIVATPGGAEGTVALGKGVVKGATKGINVLRRILKFDDVLTQAKQSKNAIDLIRDTLGKAKELAIKDVKDLPVNFDLKKIPERVLAKLRDPANGYNIDFMPDGSSMPQNMENMDKVKMALQNMPSTKDFVEAGNMAKRQIINLSKDLRDAMVSTANKAGKPELGKTLKDFHEFMNNYDLINDHLVNKHGVAMGNKLKETFKWTAEPAVKEAWKVLGKSNPEIKAIIKSRQNRELMKGLLKVYAPATAGLTATGLGIKRLLE